MYSVVSNVKNLTKTPFNIFNCLRKVLEMKLHIFPTITKEIKKTLSS